MKTGAKILLGGAALYLLSRTLGQGTANAAPGGSLPATNSQDPNTIGVDPNTMATQGTAKDIQLGVSATTGILGAGATIVGGLVKGGIIGGGVGGGAAAAGAAGGGSAGTGAATGSTTGIAATLAISPAAIAGGAAVVILIVASIVTTLAFKAVHDMAEAASAFVKSTIGPNPAYFFKQFVANLTVNGARVASMSGVPDTIRRRLLLTAMWLWYSPQKYTNDILYSFYVNAGYPEGRRPNRYYAYSLGFNPNAANQQVVADYAALFASKSALARWGAQLTPQNATAMGEFWSGFGFTMNEAYALGLTNFDGYAAATATPAEMEAAARETLGDKYNAIIGLLKFNEAVSALAFAGQQIYTQGAYPGDLKFTQDLQNTMLPSWSISTGMFWTLDGRQQAGTWLVDPVTGSRVDPAQIRRYWQIKPFVSIKGQVMSGTPGYPAGSTYAPNLPQGATFLAGYNGGRSRRRFAGFGAPPAPLNPFTSKPGESSQCVDHTSGVFVTCGDVEREQAYAKQQGALTQAVDNRVKADREQTYAAALEAQAIENARLAAARGGGAGALLPLLAAGGAAYLLLKKGKG